MPLTCPSSTLVSMCCSACPHSWKSVSTSWKVMSDGVTELATILLDARSSDYFSAQGVWVQVPLANLEPH